MATRPMTRGFTAKRALTAREVRDLESEGSESFQGEAGAYAWFAGTVNVRELTRRTLWGVSEGVFRGRWSVKSWLRWADEEVAEGYDFDSLPIAAPITVTLDAPDHLHLWDGWHRALVWIASSKAKTGGAEYQEVPVVFGVLRPGRESETERAE